MQQKRPPTEYELELIRSGTFDKTGPWVSFIDLTGANLEEAKLESAEMASASLKKANFYKANLKRAHLQQANMEQGNFQWADFQDASMAAAIMINAYLQLANLQDAYLEGAIMEGAQLQGANLHDANLKNANLTKANLNFADLSRACLENTNFTGAQLQTTNWQKVRSWNVNFNLTGADLTGSNITSKQLLSSSSLYRTVLPEFLADKNHLPKTREQVALENKIISSYIEGLSADIKAKREDIVLAVYSVCARYPDFSLLEWGQKRNDGCHFYVMSSIPQNLERYKNSYILTGDKLTYITSDEVPQTEPVNIVDMGKFWKDLLEIDPNINTNQQNLNDSGKFKNYFLSVNYESKKSDLHLSYEQVNALITSNGGHNRNNFSPLFYNELKMIQSFQAGSSSGSAEIINEMRAEIRKIIGTKEEKNSYEYKRTTGFYSFTNFSRRERRLDQIGELRRLLDLDVEDSTIFLEGLFAVKNSIEQEDNILSSQLLNCINDMLQKDYSKCLSRPIQPQTIHVWR